MAQDAYPGIAEIADIKIRTALRLIWDRISGIVSNTFGPRTGTLNPDQRPVLTTTDVGAVFAATDYNRRFRWSGSAWEDDPQAPARYQITYFLAGQVPGIGWVRCDGSAVNASTSDGRTVYFETPVIPALNGQPAWIRL